MAQAVGQLKNAVVGSGRGEGLANGRAGEGGVQVGPALAGQVCLYPPMLLGDGDQVGVVEGIGCGRAIGDVTGNGADGREHSAEQRLGVGGGERPLPVAGGEAGGAQHGDEGAGLVYAVARRAPDGTPGAAQAAGVGVVGEGLHGRKGGQRLLGEAGRIPEHLSVQGVGVYGGVQGVGV